MERQYTFEMLLKVVVRGVASVAKLAGLSPTWSHTSEDVFSGCDSYLSSI